jgi:hypothetical protein
MAPRVCVACVCMYFEAAMNVSPIYAFVVLQEMVNWYEI